MSAQEKAKELFVAALGHLEAREHAAAEQLLRDALDLMPGRESILINLSSALIAQKKNAEALAFCDAAINANPANPVSWHNKASALLELGQIDSSLSCFERAIGLQPDYAAAHGGKGVALEKKGLLPEAQRSHDLAISLDPADAALYTNRGATLHKRAMLAEALADYDVAISLGGGTHETHSNRGNVLMSLNRVEEAKTAFRQAIALDDAYVPARWNLGLAELVSGDFASGWDNFESRWEDASICGGHAPFEMPAWRGQDLRGKSILLHAEQGLGDTIQFFRYARRVADLGAEVTCLVQRPLEQLLAASCDYATVRSTIPQTRYDFHCPFMSLPRAFETDQDSIPNAVPYLTIPPERRAKWRSLVRDIPGLKVGLAWSGNAQQANDHNRSMTLAMLAPLLAVNATFISLQKEIRAADQDTLRQMPRVLDPSAAINDFADTAALIQELDLVISVCTSVAHVTGALGKPLWVLLPFAADWRWFLNRSDSPWYPSATLFRQETLGDWSRPVREAQIKLERLIPIP